MRRGGKGERGATAGGGDNTEARLASLDELRRVFGDTIRSETNKWLRLVYGRETNFCHMHYSFDKSRPELVIGMTIERPVPVPRLWKAVYALMKDFDYFLYWPDCRAPLVANGSVVVPSAFVERLGQPAFIEKAEEIPERIETL